MFEEKTEALNATPEPLYTEIFPTAAALLWQDKLFLCALYPLLIVVSLGVLVLPTQSPTVSFGAMLLERLLQILFMYLVFARWIKKVSQVPRKIGTGATIRFFLIGLLMWGVFAVPLLLSPMFPVASLALVGALFWFWMRYYFYPLPILLGCSPLKRSLAIATEINRGVSALPIRLMVAPTGILLVLSGIAMSPSPDGRIEAVYYILNITSGFFWVVATYLTLAASLLRISDQVWRENNLDPYRTARLSTLRFQGSSWVAKQLRPKHGFGWITIGALIWCANWARLSVMAPPGDQTVETIAIHGPTVEINLHLVDPEYHFKVLDTTNFALAGGENRSIVASTPDKVALVPDSNVPVTDDTADLSIPDNASDIHLNLRFTANRSGSDLSALKDLYLWYRSARLVHLDMDKATVTEVASRPKGEDSGSK